MGLRNTPGALVEDRRDRREPDLAGVPNCLHLAESHEAAERWLTQHRYSNVLLNEVTEDEVGADVVEGRAA